MDPGPPGKKRKTGRRCMVFGCGNEAQHGFFMHKMPGKMPSGQQRFSALQRSWINFINRTRHFDTQRACTYREVIVCSGHFVKEDYEPSDVMMNMEGLRTKTPALKRDAVPSVYEANHPFSTSYTSSSSSLASTLPSSASSSSSSTLPASSLTSVSRRESIYIKKKEVADIFVEFDKEEEEKRRKAVEKEEDKHLRDFMNRSKEVQFSPEVRNHKVGTLKVRVSKVSCRVQVKPRGISRGTQVSFTEKAATDSSTLQVADVGVQTSESDEDTYKEEEIEDIEIEEFEDDEKRDPSYEPEEDAGVSKDDEIIKVKPHSDILQEEKYIVFESNLMALFQTCVGCHKQTVVAEKIRPKSFGSQLRIRTTCASCGKVWEWDSQPRVGNFMAGNILLSAAILFGGASPAKVLRLLNHMNLKVISNRTFLDHQKDWLQPAIIQVFKRMQGRLVRSIDRDEKLTLGGDGRADSPGHSAKFGSYSLMDIKRRKILDIQLVQSNEVTSSNAMENEGLVRCLAKVEELGLQVGSLITDRHTQVAKWLRENHPEIDHRYDVWHIAKGIQKKMKALSKQKDCEAALLWKRSVVNHVYWCASSTPSGDGQLIEAKYKSIFNHVRGIHEHESQVFPKCEHQEDYPQREWMRDGSKVYVKMCDDLLKTRLVNDIKKMSPIGQTSSVEAFHSVLLHWAPKMLAYSYPGMKCRLMLAVMHWNENSDRDQATRHSDGTPIFKLTYQKAKEGRPTVSKVLTACTFDYVEMLMEEMLALVSQKQKLRDEMPELEDKPSLSSKYERPIKEEVIQQAQMHRRFTES